MRISSEWRCSRPQFVSCICGSGNAGKLADLVLLDANPLTDIRNLLKIRAVVTNGRYFDRATLDAPDPDGVKAAKNFAEQSRPAGASITEGDGR
jgi:hypothetical protein